MSEDYSYTRKFLEDEGHEINPPKTWICPICNNKNKVTWTYDEGFFECDCGYCINENEI